MFFYVRGVVKMCRRVHLYLFHITLYGRSKKSFSRECGLGTMRD